MLRDGNFELRDYPALVVAEVTVEGDQKEAASKGFRLLAGYIFGANKKRQSIAMTAPVEQMQGASGTWVVRFTMPSAWTLQTLPIPNDSKVTLRATELSRLAVLRFSGLAKPEDVQSNTRELLAHVTSRVRHRGRSRRSDSQPAGDIQFLRPSFPPIGTSSRRALYQPRRRLWPHGLGEGS